MAPSSGLDRDGNAPTLQWKLTFAVGLHESARRGDMRSYFGVQRSIRGERMGRRELAQLSTITYGEQDATGCGCYS